MSREWESKDCQNKLTWYSIGGKKRKRQTKNYLDGIHGMIEMGYGEDWRDGEKWQQKITGQTQIATGKCKSIA